MIFENFEITFVFKNALGQFIPNCPLKLVITGTNWLNEAIGKLWRAIKDLLFSKISF